MAEAQLSVVPKNNESYLKEVKDKFMLSQDLCEPARREWNIDQGYYDGPGQWTPEERQILRSRNQSDSYFNEVKPSVNGMIGIVERGKVDPRAWGRTPEDNDSAEVVTEVLRYVADSTRFLSIRSQCLKDMLIQGICVAAVEIDPDTKEVLITKGRPETFFYDPYSREHDFSDARWMGLAPWMDESEVIAKYPEYEAKIRQAVDSGNNGLSVQASALDRPTEGWAWADSKARRLMLVEMFHRKGPIWQRCVFVSSAILEEGESPYKDQNGKPTCQLVAQSAYVDSNNRRYGAVRDMRGPQDAMNKGWSKSIHIINTAKLRVDPGTQDIDNVRKEWAKPDGIIEAREGQVEELGDKQLLPAHMELLNLAEQKMRRQAPTPGIVGRQSASQSGKAILAEQQAGLTEQAPILGQFDDWTLRIYRAIWGVAKQFWDAQKYIRTTDDENAPHYVMLNEPAIQMQIGPDGVQVPVVGPDGKPVIDKTKPPRNQPAKMDVDIIIDSQPDVATLQETQFQSLLELAQTALQTQAPEHIPFKLLVQASSLPNKRELLDALKEQEEAREKAAQNGPPPSPEVLAVQAKAQAQAQQMQLDAQVADHKAQLAQQQAQAEFQLKQLQAQNDQALAQKEFELEVWKTQQDAAVKREAIAAQVGLDQELADHEAIMAERKLSAELELKTKAQAHEQRLSGDKHNAEKKRTLAMAKAAKGEPVPDEPIEPETPPPPPPKKIGQRVTVSSRGPDGKAKTYDIQDVFDQQQPQTMQ